MGPEYAFLGAAICAVVLVALVVGALAWARSDARSQEARAGAAELQLERDRRERAEQARDVAERRVQVLAHVGREYLARVPADGRVDRARLRVLLDETQHAAGAAPPPAAGPAAEGGDVDGAGVA